MTARNAYNKNGLIIESDSLADLITKSKNQLLKFGNKSTSQRGQTWSLNNILLVWRKPEIDETRFNFWSQKDDLWYQKNFVGKKGENKPENLALKGELLFPYKYAHRSRFYDSGLGYGLAVIRAYSKVGKNFNLILKKRTDFEGWLSEMGKFVHLQTIMSVLLWWGKDGFEFWSKNEKFLEGFIKRSRIDTLDKVVNEVSETSLTRRAIIPSFMYTGDYLLHPMMGVPPYQNFQLLPTESNEPLSSLHWHRSLDTSGGAQLDFNHDYSWLVYACEKTRRPMGSITILAGNLHLYSAREDGKSEGVLENDSIKKRLCMWTDGYESGKGLPGELLKNENYSKNADRVFTKLKYA